jgi:xanthine dehydrogenase YagS FAD-binding subunit
VKLGEAVSPKAKAKERMNRFTYAMTDNISAAIREISAGRGTKFIAGGTNLLDLMKENVARPTRLVNVTGLPLSRIERLENGGLKIGALMTNSALAYHPEVQRRYPVLSKAILFGASAQLRNMATTGGNLLQRTRCCYFYDLATPCNKRDPGAGCSAIEGFNRMHAILGASESCIAVHPSDMCVALAALEAIVHVTGKNGERAIPFAEFHRLPADTAQIDTNLGADELITGVELPAKGFAEHYTYLKIRDRASYAFALVSVAATLEMKGNEITEARLALGGVAHKPWRNREVEALLIGKAATKENFQSAAAAMVRDARGFRFNRFKIELARRAIIRALEQGAQGTPQHLAGSEPT